jgi:thioesterase superfamily protein 4
MGETALARLSTIPWCHTLLSSPQWTLTNTASRVPKASTEDSFFAETLHTDRTIRACLTIRPTEESDGADGAMIFPEVKTIVELGDGLNGFPTIAHGGFVATMLDEVMGVLITSNMSARSKRMGLETDELMGAFTACVYLEVGWGDGFVDVEQI